MKTLVATLLTVVLALSGCATGRVLPDACEQHPLACSIGAAVIVGSVAATVEANQHHSQPVSCAATPSLCQ